MGILCHILDVVNPLTRHLIFYAEGFLHLIRVAGSHPVFQDAVEFLGSRSPTETVFELGIPARILGVYADGLAQAGKRLVRRVDAEPLSVLALVRVPGHGQRVFVPQPLRDLFVVEIVDGGVRKHAEHGLVLGDVHGLPFACPQRVDISRQGRPECEQAGDVITDVGFCRHGRGGIRIADHCHQAAECLADHVIGGPVNVAGITALAVAGNVHDHELRVPFPHRLVRQAQLVIRTGYGTLYPDVRLVQQFQQDLSCFVRLQIQGEAPLVPLFLSPPGMGHPVNLPHGRFNVDHVRAEVCSERGRPGSGVVPSAVDDPQPLQRTERLFLFLTHASNPLSGIFPVDSVLSPISPTLVLGFS